MKRSKKSKPNIKRPLLLIIFSIIFGGLVNISMKSTFLKENKTVAGFVVILILVVALLGTFYISENYLSKFFNRIEKK